MISGGSVLKHYSFWKTTTPTWDVNIEYYMESAPVRCLHTICGVSEIERVRVANEWDFWYKTTSV